MHMPMPTTSDMRAQARTLFLTGVPMLKATTRRRSMPYTDDTEKKSNLTSDVHGHKRLLHAPPQVRGRHKSGEW
jgi:hypothetical protein